MSQLMDDLDLIIEQGEVMVNSIQKGVENVSRKQCRLKHFCSCNVGEFARCFSDLFYTFPKQMNTLLDCAAQARADKNFIDCPNQFPIHLDKLSHIRDISRPSTSAMFQRICY